MSKKTHDSILEGVLVCSNADCLGEYPIIDGVPIVVADLRNYVSQNIIPILSRSDLSETTESLLGDCCGPGSAFDSYRQHLSTYTFDHYGNLDSNESEDAPVLPGSVLNLLKQGLTGLDKKVGGAAIDLGCAVGRTSFELARTIDDLIIGVDLNFAMLRTAAAILHHGRVAYPKRRVGIVFDKREFAAAFEGSSKVDFWACDATLLPFADESFALAASLNVIDCVQSPYDHLKELGRVLKANGGAIICAPYDWNVNVTPAETWLGGHSQRSESRGASENMLRSLLAGGEHPYALQELELISESEALPWSLRLHDRSFMNYLVHLLVVRKRSSSPPSLIS
ncbi:MAG: methyltransferase domain-containing protein [Deltaproteobacteria bacterium]|nr:methyltransferase domain-containing protein [Deltaproteobacteria bacterium]